MNDNISLNLVTHFEASHGQLHSDHLEQLAVACPDLLELNLRKNNSCLKSLQGLHVIATDCQSLRGLNLSFIPIKDVEGCVQLWRILAVMKLTYLAIDLCALFPRVEDEQELVGLCQKCLNLKALDVWRNSLCTNCKIFASRDFFVLSNFLSLALCSLWNVPNTMVTIEDIVSSCLQLKYFRYTYYYSTTLPVCSLAHQCNHRCNLEQLCIESRCDFSVMFMHTVSAHGGLVHVILCGKSVTFEGVSMLI